MSPVVASSSGKRYWPVRWQQKLTPRFPPFEVLCARGDVAGFARFNTTLFSNGEMYGLTVYPCKIVGQNFKERHNLSSRRMLGESVTYSCGIDSPDAVINFKCRFGDSSSVRFVDLWNAMVNAERAAETRIQLRTASGW